MSDDFFSKIEAKLDRIVDDVGELKINQAVMQEDVKHHVKRSDMLEELYISMKEKDVEPLQKDMNQIHGVVKFLGLLGILSTIILAVLKIVGH